MANPNHKPACKCVACSPATRKKGMKALEALRAADKPAQKPAKKSAAAKADKKPVNKPRRNPGPTKAELLDQIRSVAQRAATHRLAGNVAKAQALDEKLEALHAIAQRRRFGDAAVQAEEDGRESATRDNPAVRRVTKRTASQKPAAAPATRTRGPGLPSLEAGRVLVIVSRPGKGVTQIKAFGSQTAALEYVRSLSDDAIVRVAAVTHGN